MVFTRAPYHALPLDMTGTYYPFSYGVLNPGHYVYTRIICPRKGRIRQIEHAIGLGAYVRWRLFRGADPTVGTLVTSGYAENYLYPGDVVRQPFIAIGGLDIPCEAGEIYTIELRNETSSQLSFTAMIPYFFTMGGPIYSSTTIMNIPPEYPMAPAAMAVECRFLGNIGWKWAGQPFHDAETTASPKPIIGEDHVRWLYSCFLTGYYPFLLRGVIVPIAVPVGQPPWVQIAITNVEWINLPGYAVVPRPMLNPVSVGTATLVKCATVDVVIGPDLDVYYAIYRLPDPMMFTQFAVGVTSNVVGTRWFYGFLGYSTWSTWETNYAFGRGAWDRTVDDWWRWKTTVVRPFGVFGDQIIPARRRVFYT